METIPCQLGGFIARRPALPVRVPLGSLLKGWAIYLGVLVALASVSIALQSAPHARVVTPLLNVAAVPSNH